MIILFSGQPASGKTTLADALYHQHGGYRYVRLDGDKWRDITKNKDYSKQGRIANLISAFNAALYLEQNGYTPILSFVTPYEEMREYLKQNAISFKHIFLKYDGDRGRNSNFVSDFEQPNECEVDILRIDTSQSTVSQSLNEVKQFLQWTL